MVSLWLALGTGFAQSPADDEAVEEIIVWGNPFERWEKRWYVESEVAFPYPFRIMGDLNHEVWVQSLQIRAVMACRNDGGSKRLIEARCEIEDIALTGLTPRRRITEARKGVLIEIDAALTGSEVQLQANAKGTVPNVDLEGLSNRNNRMRERGEALRQVMMRSIVPFHLKLPKTIRVGAKWYDTNSRMMSIPTMQKASMGGVQVAHFMNRYQEQLLVQSIGKAMVKVPGQLSQRTGELDTTDFVEIGAMRFDLQLDSVAIFDPASGIMTDRVWAVRGQTVASSPSTLPIPYHHVGMLHMLGDRERPEVGATTLVDTEDWTAWTPPQ